MKRPEVAVVKTGVANTASILAGLQRAGAQASVVESARQVEQSAIVVLPGVGAFGAGMAALEQLNIAEVLRRRFDDGRPTLAVCLGLQLLFARSEETPGVAGLGIFTAEIKRFTGAVRIPQLGWNRVEPLDQSALLLPGYAYFANSYCAEEIPPGWTGAYAEHGKRFVAALERDGMLCCQFHPELSGSWGMALLERWIKRAAAETAA